MRYAGAEKLEIIRLVEQSSLSRRRTLVQLGIPKSTFYAWYSRYLDGGSEALDDRRPAPAKASNQVPEEIREAVIELALEQPERSPRELATAVNQLWQTDFTHLKVIRKLPRKSDKQLVELSGTLRHSPVVLYSVKLMISNPFSISLTCFCVETQTSDQSASFLLSGLAMVSSGPRKESTKTPLGNSDAVILHHAKCNLSSGQKYKLASATINEARGYSKVVNVARDKSTSLSSPNRFWHRTMDSGSISKACTINPLDRRNAISLPGPQPQSTAILMSLILLLLTPLS